VPSSDRDPKNKLLRNPLEGEDDDLKKSVDKYLNEQGMSYFEKAKIRDARVGKPRIGTSFSLREDFYSAMWPYYFKDDYLLGTDPTKMVDNMNMPDVDVMNGTKKDQVSEPLINPGKTRNIIEPSDDDF
jgi:hypothetical protein